MLWNVVGNPTLIRWWPWYIVISPLHPPFSSWNVEKPMDPDPGTWSGLRFFSEVVNHLLWLTAYCISLLLDVGHQIRHLKTVVWKYKNKRRLTKLSVKSIHSRRMAKSTFVERILEILKLGGCPINQNRSHQIIENTNFYSTRGSFMSMETEMNWNKVYSNKLCIYGE